MTFSGQKNWLVFLVADFSKLVQVITQLRRRMNMVHGFLLLSCLTRLSTTYTPHPVASATILTNQNGPHGMFAL
jgi:hypothetical protein